MEGSPGSDSTGGSDGRGNRHRAIRIGVGLGPGVGCGVGVGMGVGVGVGVSVVPPLRSSRPVEGPKSRLEPEKRKCGCESLEAPTKSTEQRAPALTRCVE